MILGGDKMATKKKATTLYLDEAEYKEIKKHLIEIDKSLNAYVTELIRKDMEKGNVNVKG